MNRKLWEVWKDTLVKASGIWRMKTPIGILCYTRKRDAVKAMLRYNRAKL